MKKTTASLCFTHNEFLNPQALKFIEANPISTVAFFTDGSEGAIEMLQRFDIQLLTKRNLKIALHRTPLHEMRVMRQDGVASNPHYVYTDAARSKWICQKIVANYIDVSVSTIDSQSGTMSMLDPKLTEVVCYLGYRLWKMIQAVEDKLCFPAVAIDRMTRWTYHLSRETMDMVALRKETGLTTLDYNPKTDILSLTVGEEIFTVKLSILNQVYGQFVLPWFNEIMGRHMRIKAVIKGRPGTASEPFDVSYCQLGRLVDKMRIYAQERRIDSAHPLSPHDLTKFSMKVKVHEESCVFLSEGQSFYDFVEDNRSLLVHPPVSDASSNTSPSARATAQLEGVDS